MWFRTTKQLFPAHICNFCFDGLLGIKRDICSEEEGWVVGERQIEIEWREWEE